MVTDGVSSFPEGSGDIGGGDGLGVAVVVVVDMEGCVWRGTVVTKVGSPTTGGSDRAEEGVTAGVLSNRLSSDSILLVSVGKRHMEASLHVIQRGC